MASTSYHALTALVGLAMPEASCPSFGGALLASSKDVECVNKPHQARVRAGSAGRQLM